MAVAALVFLVQADQRTPIRLGKTVLVVLMVVTFVYYGTVLMERLEHLGSDTSRLGDAGEPAKDRRRHRHPKGQQGADPHAGTQGLKKQKEGIDHTLHTPLTATQYLSPCYAFPRRWRSAPSRFGWRKA